MSKEFDLSRRKVLAGLGTIGVAGATAGLGTSAYFSDEETYEGNQLVAGELDMTAGWSSHYSNWSDDESNDLDGDVQMEDGGSIADSTRVGLPANDAALISVQDADDAETLLANTLQNQYPDGFVTDSTLADDDNSPAVISLDDVKPGDFGEVSFSFALNDNPGYVWAGAFLESASENTVTEPESEDDDEESGVVELLDAIQVGIWLDDGNNYQNCGERPLTVGSLRDVVNGDAPQIENNGLRLDGRKKLLADAVASDFTAYGVNRFDTDEDGSYDADVELHDDPAGTGKVAHATSNGTETSDYVTTSICLDEAPTLGDLTADSGQTTLTYEYFGGAQNLNSVPDEVYLLIEEGSNGDDPGTEHVVFRASNDDSPAAQTWKTRNVHREVAGNPDNNAGFNWMEITASGIDNLGSGGPTSDLSTIYGDDAVVRAMAAGRGTTGGGDVLDAYYKNPMVDGNSAGTFPTDGFRGDGAIHSGVLAWWLPVDHANEIQTDSATFTLGLYTEQYRHNDGSGPAFDSE